MNTHFRQLFDAVVDVNIDVSFTEDSMYTMGHFQPVGQVMGNRVYTVRIRFLYDEQLLMRAHYPRDPYSNEWMHSLNIGRYRVQSLNQHMVPHLQALQVLVEYKIPNDLDDFMAELKRHSWEVYNNRMNNLIDGVLSVDGVEDK